MLQECNTGTKLPQAPARVPLADLKVKEAVGVALWNGLRGTQARIYLAKVRHPTSGNDVIRFLGGTAVPTSPVSSWNQSLIWIQNYLGVEIRQEAIADFAVLHRAYYFEQPLLENPLDSTEQATSFVPGHEIHGILPCEERFLSRHAARLVELQPGEDGRVQTGDNLEISNAIVGRIVREMLATLLGGDLRCKVEVHFSNVRGRATAPLAQ